MRLDEFAFETEIVGWLVERAGYTEGALAHFDAERGIDTAELFAFIGATQIEAWNRLIMLHGGDPDTAQRAFGDRLAKELDSRGTVDVLRRGVVDLGVTIQLAYFRPAYGLTRELVKRYEANRLTVTRQLRYEATSGKALDLALFVNGLPVATAEVRNPLTGHSSQTGESAKDLKIVLGAGPRSVSAVEEQLRAAEAADASVEDQSEDPVADVLAAAVRARARQRNISFFAFTATPKGRTLEQFGRINPATGMHEALHLYRMRQAIEEGFILDVLASYVTYQTYWNIEKAVAEDPAYQASKAKAAIARFVSLPPRCCRRSSTGSTAVTSAASMSARPPCPSMPMSLWTSRASW